MKSNFFIFLLFLLTALSSLFFHAECAKGQTQTASGSALSLSSPSVVLIESNTGKVLFEKSKDEEDKQTKSLNTRISNIVNKLNKKKEG